MLNLKKVIALVCVFALTLTTVAFGATYSDVTEDSAYYEAVETLNKLNIITGYEDGTFRPEDGVTRAEMAALIARIQGYGETAAAPANTVFSDVPSSHWASGYIANASGMGIINGYGDGTFGPEDPVLYEQAVKMIMATLGYTPFAEKNGGYPTGYLAAAQRYDVSLSVANAAVGQQANRGTIAQLLVNALDTPLMIQAKWSTDGTVDYVIADSNTTGYPYQTLMSANLGYVKLRGVVKENALVAVGAAKTINTDNDEVVEIDVKDTFDAINKDFAWNASGAGYLGETTFLVGDTDVADYIGRSVIVYVKKAADKYEVVSVAVDTNRNDELVINLDQYAGYDTTEGEIDYYKDGANTTTGAKVAGADAIFNNTGMALTNALGNIVADRGGSITLIDNDDVKGYDVVIIKQAQTGVVDEVTSKAISFHNSTMQSINLNIDESKVVDIIKDGEYIDAAELNEWDILSIYWVNKNSDYIVAEVVADQIVGTITSKKDSTTSGTGKAYKIDGAWYDAAEGAYDEGMDTNEGGTFYIDEFGKIAAFIEDAALAGGAASNYGYINGLKLDDADFGGAADYVVKVQLVTADGVDVYKLKSNATLCGNGVDNDTQINTETWKDDDNNAGFGTGDTGYTEWQTVQGFANEVVQYTKNSAGYITKLVAAGYQKTNNDEAAFTTAGITGSVKWDEDNFRFTSGKGGYVDEDALVFITDGDAANCKLGSLADLADNNSYTVTKSYKDKKADYTSIIVVSYKDIAKTSTTDAIAVITEVGETTNENGESIWTLAYLQDGELVEVETTSDVAAQPTTPNPGDIVKVKIGSEGTVVAMEIVWNFSTDIRAAKVDDFVGTSADYVLPTANSSLIAQNSTAGEAFYGGYVVKYAKNSKLVDVANTLGASSSDKQFKLTSAENIYVIDATGRDLYIDTASAGDFTYNKALYDGSTNVKITDNEGNCIKGTAVNFFTDTSANPNAAKDISVAIAQGYADWIFVRLYEDKPVDVIIVKGADLTIE